MSDLILMIQSPKEEMEKILMKIIHVRLWIYLIYETVYELVLIINKQNKPFF